RAARLDGGIVVVSGTNGKTTTAAMIAAILRSGGDVVVTNASGANLFRGVAASLATMPTGSRAGVFEVDEGALARLVPALRPRARGVPAVRRAARLPAPNHRPPRRGLVRRVRLVHPGPAVPGRGPRGVDVRFDVAASERRGRGRWDRRTAQRVQRGGGGRGGV